MRKWFLLYFIGLICIAVSAQNTIGILSIVNYSKTVYKAGNQNWGIAQDRKGIKYFANHYRQAGSRDD